MRKAFIFSALLTILSTASAQQLDIAQSGHFATLKLSSEQYADWNDDAFSKNDATVQTYTKLLYENLSDDFDFIVLVRNAPDLDGFSYYGKSLNVKNDVTGIGVSVFSNAAKYGSAGRLQQIIHMPARDVISNGPFLHEILHRWANHAFPTVNSGHWGYMGGSTPGQIGGFLQSSLKPVEGKANTYTVDYFGSNANGGNSVPYNELELYMMGLIPLSSVSPFSAFTNINSKDVSVDQQTGVTTFVSDSRTDYTPASIEALLGKRTPDYTSSQKDFNVLFVVITDCDLSASDYKEIEDQIVSMCQQSATGNNLYNFFSATGGRATLSTGDLNAKLLDHSKSISLTAPTAVASVKNFKPLDIKWTTNLSGNIRIDLYQHGAFLCNIATGIPASSGKYTWNVDLSELYDSSDISIRLVSEDSPLFYTFSAAPFDVTTQQFTISGKVLNAKGNPVPDAIVTTGNKAAYISSARDDDSNRYYRLCTTVEQEFTATEPTVIAVEFKPNIRETSQSIEFGILNSDKTVVVSKVVQSSTLSHRELNRIDFDKPVSVTPGETYYFYFRDPGYPNTSIYYYYIDDNSKPVYRIWSADGVSTQTDTEGKYAISLPERWSGRLTAIADGLSFPHLSFSRLSNDFLSVDFTEGAPDALRELSVAGAKVIPSSNAVLIYGFSGNVTIYDLTGRPVSSSVASGSQVKISVPRHGLYILSLGDSSTLLRL
ncbi:MAG: hypothetical protein II951_00315 [Bacteroidales bacterium]|nr:hypothetical protein [Bacteroidales bacterium]